ncbi:ECF transporter S component [Serpentinicella alkaliphila]|uniref:Putative membrane protein n=1 Tax=Serpentinicella alkaliphila TaxID=1734049 RepID=A0A4R2TFD4_9FIRM|nr:ECF transporter S component [Serpentinicella alkaliphila]QUH25775.1 ECF transporter S component [Serpentinicella alkaliphila]TCP99774.1 putative membrane protein [Serpentinicella alkaliphila]
MNTRKLLYNLIITGLLMALVTVATMLIKVPIPVTNGYIHVGDSMIFLAAIMFGKRKGALAGGIGSAFADLLWGYPQWILPTLVVKGLMGYLVGAIADQDNDNVINLRNILALVIGAITMATGYLFVGAIMTGSFVAVLVEGFPADLVQGFGGAALFIPIGIALKKTDYFKGSILNKSL